MENDDDNADDDDTGNTPDDSDNITSDTDEEQTNISMYPLFRMDTQGDNQESTGVIPDTNNSIEASNGNLSKNTTVSQNNNNGKESDDDKKDENMIAIEEYMAEMSESLDR